MSDFPGHAQRAAVLARMISELKKTVLTAGAPRVFSGSTGLAVSGGYGLTLPSTDLPEHWGAGRITSAKDPMCPIWEAWRWRDVDSGASIDGPALSPFVVADLRDESDDALDDLLYGCGYLLVEVSDVQLGGPNFGGSIGQGADQRWPVEVGVTIRVPSGRGPAQGDLYAGCLARIFADTSWRLAATEALEFGGVPETAQIQADENGWLSMAWSAVAERVYNTPRGKVTYQ